MTKESQGVLVEVCLQSADAAVAAEAGGADRVELCDNLVEGGTTPSLGMIEVTRASIDIGMHVIIRPRGGDFLYSDREMEVMLRDVRAARECGVNGVVIGLLTADGRVDRERCARLMDEAGDMAVTFHRAFDVCRDPWEALGVLIDMGVDRILTSGQQPTVLEGLDLIAALHREAGERITILPGCGITPHNLPKVLAVGVREIHVVANREQVSGMAFRHPDVYMGTELRTPEYARSVTHADEVRRFVGDGGHAE